eukprot:CAMPEP_0194548844 /NCGR_PEP_ID=MMETSP0253-20130528/94253_1 /TAXON_ID=2966 /ORGANISM="Noctiluca scintillans" /LENGTH=64 /DNA_ID=CAMNT_0039396201 /DNA_START=106 /DNA_END=300 /DNA_ORIENTATION=-
MTESHLQNLVCLKLKERQGPGKTQEGRVSLGKPGVIEIEREAAFRGTKNTPENLVSQTCNEHDG